MKLNHSRCPHTPKAVSLLVLAEILILFALIFRLLPSSPPIEEASSSVTTASDSIRKGFIKWVDFNVTADAMRQALRLDVDSYNQTPHLNWLELLAYLGARYGGDFSQYQASDMEHLAQQLKEGASMEELTKDMKYYS